MSPTVHAASASAGHVSPAPAPAHAPAPAPAPLLGLSPAGLAGNGNLLVLQTLRLGDWDRKLGKCAWGLAELCLITKTFSFFY